MKFYKYTVIIFLFVIAGCSSDEDAVPKTQSVEQTEDVKQTQPGTEIKKTESKGLFSHYVDSVNQAKAVKQLAEDADKKKKELEEGI